MKILIARWQHLSARERHLLLICGGLLLIWLLHVLLWQPLQQQRERWQRTLAREQNTVAWMLQQAPRLRQASAPPAAAPSISPASAITQRAAALGITVIRLQPQGKRLAVSLAPTEFTLLIRCLTQVERLSGARVITLDVTRHAERSGWVTVNTLIVEQRDGR